MKWGLTRLLTRKRPNRRLFTRHRTLILSAPNLPHVPDLPNPIDLPHVVQDTRIRRTK